MASLSDWLQRLESLHPHEIELGLERVASVAQRLGLSQPAATVVTVAGTNGKGSCVALVSHLLCAQDLHVGTYTSPHLLRYNERVQVNGREVDDDALIDAFERIDAVRGDTSLTYFEFGTLAAFLIFTDHQLDYWILEVGLGGRLDAVNILDPDIAVITSIDLDHQQWLGDTREAITQEKLGILRDQVPCVLAESNPTPNTFAIMEQHRVPSWCINRDFSIVPAGDLQSMTISLSERDKNKRRVFKIPDIRLPAPSVAAALQVLALCDRLPEEKILAKQCIGIRLPGRFDQRECRGLQYVLDVAHNPAAAELLAQKMASNNKERIVAVVAMMKDKDIQSSLRPFIDLVDSWMLGSCPDNMRLEQSQTIATILREFGCEKIVQHEDIEAALNSATQAAHDFNDLGEKAVVLVFGSFITVGLAYNYLNRMAAQTVGAAGEQRWTTDLSNA